MLPRALTKDFTKKYPTAAGVNFSGCHRARHESGRTSDALSDKRRSEALDRKRGEKIQRRSVPGNGKGKISTEIVLR